MEILFLILGIVCLLTGLAGAFLPTPGPPLSFLGLLLLEWSEYATFSPLILWTLGFVTLVVLVLDYLIPIWGTKKFGGSNYGGIGAVVGGIIGLVFIPAVGLFLGTFIGAFLGELIAGADSKVALRAAVGSFVGFMTGMVIKVVLCVAMIVYAVIALVIDASA